MPIDAVFSDMDGVICDSERVHYKAFSTLLAENGVPLSENDYFEKYCHGDDRAVLSAVFRDRDIDNVPLLERLLEEKAELCLRLLRDDLVLLDGTVDFLKRYHAAGKTICVISMARRDEVLLGLEKAGLDGMVSCIVSADDVQHVKPDPEPYRMALEQANRIRASSGQPELSAGRCLVLEDTPGGVAAGVGAGMPVWGIGTTRPPLELLRAGAQRVFTDLAGVDIRTEFIVN